MSTRLQRFWRKLGPGMITGASDDDPSGIATYADAGARFGPQLLWTALVTLPLMVAVQEMCARIGLVTRTGLMGNIRRHYPRWLTVVILVVSFPAIAFNIGADIAAMGAVTHLLLPAVPDFAASAIIAVGLTTALIIWDYRRIAQVLKWLCLALFAYLLIPFVTATDWGAALRSTLLPALELNRGQVAMLVAILGTTISPYLFFWQANMEVEEVQRRKLVVDKHVLADMETDVRSGMGFSNLVMFFIILTSGTVLHTAGIRGIATVQEAAEALRPLAGDGAYLLFAAGILGTGLLAIPVLAGALSYMLAETFGWQQGLDRRFHEAKGFYLTMVVAIAVGLSIDYFEVSPIRALLWTAIGYGLTAPVLIGVLLHLCNQPGIMGEHVNSRRANVLGFAALLLMTAAAVAFVVLM